MTQLKPVFPWMTAYIIAACTVVLGIQSILGTGEGEKHLPTILPMMPAYISAAFGWEYWKIPVALLSLASYAFQHSGYLHYGVNIFLFFMLAPLLEAAIGHRRMLAFCLATAVGAALAQILFTPYPGIPVVGLSGVVLGVLAALSFAVPNVELMPIPFTHLKVRLYHLGLIILAMQLDSFFRGGGVVGGDRSAYQLHLGGALTGFGLWAFWLKGIIESFKKSCLSRRSEIGMRGVIQLPPGYFD